MLRACAKTIVQHTNERFIPWQGVKGRGNLLTRIGGWLAGGGRASYRRVEITSIIRSCLLVNPGVLFKGCRDGKQNYWFTDTIQ